MPKFRKKPVVIEAIQFNGVNGKDVEQWISKNKNNRIGKVVSSGDAILMRTLKGAMRAEIGDYIIKDVKGDFFPCKPDIFEQTYELIEE